MRTCLIASYKGGVSKTVTTANIGAALADMGYRTLLVDLDPSGHLSESFSGVISDPELFSSDLINPDARSRPSLDEVAVPASDNLDIVTSDSQGLEVCELKLDRDAIKGPLALRQALNGADYDIALIDIPPRLTSLTVNALVASDAVVALIPPQTLTFYGAQAFYTKVEQVAESPLNPDLRFLGGLYTMVNPEAEETLIVKDAVAHLGWATFRAEIPYSLLASKAASRGMPAVWEFPNYPLAERYRDVARELLTRLSREGIPVKATGKPEVH